MTICKRWVVVPLSSWSFALLRMVYWFISAEFNSFYRFSIGLATIECATTIHTASSEPIDDFEEFHYFSKRHQFAVIHIHFDFVFPLNLPAVDSISLFRWYHRPSMMRIALLTSLCSPYQHAVGKLNDIEIQCAGDLFCLTQKRLYDLTRAEIQSFPTFSFVQRSKNRSFRSSFAAFSACATVSTSILVSHCVLHPAPPTVRTPELCPRSTASVVIAICAYMF